MIEDASHWSGFRRVSAAFGAAWLLAACSSASPGGTPAAIGGGAAGTPASGGAVGIAGSGVGPGGGAPVTGAGGAVNPGSGGSVVAQAGTGGVATGGGLGQGGGGAPPAGGSAGSGGAGGAGDPAPFTLSINVGTVAPGQENTQCVQSRLPNTAPIDVIRVHNTLSSASHHFIVSQLTAANAAEAPLAPCKPFRAALQGGPLAITQKKDDIILLPAGVSYAFAANQLVSLELHYINTGADPVDVHAQTELFTAAPGAPLQPSSVLLIGTTNFSIPGNQSYSTGPRYIPMPSAVDGVNYFAVTGHTHRLGTSVKVSTAASASAAPTSIYAPMPFDWDSPALAQLDPPVHVASGGGFVLQCDWQNTTSSTVSFGESALQEMCFFWAYYYPKKSVSNLIFEGIGPVDPSIATFF